MKKFFSALLAACGVVLCAAPDDAQIYRATTRHIDFDGNFITYYNSTELGELINQIPQVIEKISAFDESGKLKPAACAAELVLKAMNLSALRASAMSQKELKEDLFIYKESYYLGKNAQLPGIFSTAGLNGNLSLQAALATFPADVVFAAQFQMMPGKFHQHLDRTIKNSKHKQIQTVCEVTCKNTKVDVAKLLNSANGLYTVIFAGETEDTFRFSVTIPDNDGTIAAELKKQLPPDPKNPNRSRLIVPMKKKREYLKPEIIYLDKQIMVVSSFERCIAKNHRPYALKADFVRQLPATGAGFAVLNITPEFLANLKNLCKDKPVILTLLNTLSPASGAEVVKIAPDGVYSVGVADFSLTAAYFNFSQKLATIIDEAKAIKK